MLEKLSQCSKLGQKLGRVSPVPGGEGEAGALQAKAGMQARELDTAF